LSTFYGGHTYPNREILTKKDFSGTDLQHYFIQGQTYPKKFFWDTLATNFYLGTYFAPFFRGQTYPNRNILPKKDFPGTDLQHYFIQGQTYPKKFFWDTLAAFFIQGHTLHPFSGDRLIQIGRYLLKKISQGQTYSPILFRDILIQKKFSWGHTCIPFYSGTYFLKKISQGQTYSTILFRDRLIQKKFSWGHTCIPFYSGTYFLKKISQGQTYSTILFRDRLIQKKFSWGHTCSLFLCRDTLIYFFPGDRLTKKNFSGTHLQPTFI